MKVIEFNEKIKEGKARELWKLHLRNEITLSDKQLTKVLKLKEKRF